MMKIDLRELLKREYMMEDGLVLTRKLRNNTADKERLIKIDKDDEVNRFVEIDNPFYLLDANGAEKYMDGSSDSVTLGVSGIEEYVGSEEDGKLQGVLYIYEDDKKRIEEIEKKRLVKEKIDSYLEVGFAKYPGAKSHQISNALRSLLRMIKEVYSSQDGTLCITAYVEALNTKSIAVLEAVGFDQVGEVVYNAKKSVIPDKLYAFIVKLVKR